MFRKILTVVLFFCSLTWMQCSGNENLWTEDDGSLWTNDDGEFGPLSKACMRCICENMGCIRSPWPCSGETCGVFGITYGYWRDSFFVETNDKYDEYRKCTENEWCAARTVQHHMKRFLPDCMKLSGSRSPCETALTLHLRGPLSCAEQLDSSRQRRLHACLQRQVRSWLTTDAH